MAKQIISGNDLMLYGSDGTSIGYATSHVLTINGETTETSSKDHGQYSSVKVNKISFEITSENLYTVEEYDKLFDTMVARNPITVYFGLKTDGDEGNTVADDNYAAWSISPKALTSGASTTHVGSYSENGSVTTATHGYMGKCYITSLVANAAVGENATFSITLTGAGAIKKIGA